MDARNVTQKLIESHLVEGALEPGAEIGIRIDQTLTQDATGTMVMLELEAMGLERVRTDLSVQYVDHNLLQQDSRNPDDHLFLSSASKRFGLWFSPAGNGVSHPVHQECFGRPGVTLLGSDSHTPAAGALGMLAIGAGGIDVARAMAGQPYFVRLPEVWGVRLQGQLPDWVSAKDIILEMLRRHGVDGGVNRVIEYYGPGLEGLSVWDRHVIANMGTELGATSTVFPADDEVKRFLAVQGRSQDWQRLAADPDCVYDHHDEIDLSRLEPLVALPSSPGRVVPVREVEGRPIYQAYIGSSANPGYRDFAVAALMVENRRIDSGVSFDINPTSRQILQQLIADSHLSKLLAAGGRLHQTGCNGCIGMGQAPATGRISLRTVPRNFPGRSGTVEDQVYLVSPETATASALRGVITDPRNLEWDYPRVVESDHPAGVALVRPPLPAGEAAEVTLEKGPNIVSLPGFEPLPDRLRLPVILKVGDDISTDEILPAGSRILPFRSNIPRISEFVFDQLDPEYTDRAEAVGQASGHCIVAGRNYGQGSSREHAALAPRYLGLRVVMAVSFARIHRQNLINFGILPLTFVDPDDLDRIDPGSIVTLDDLPEQIAETDRLVAALDPQGETIELEHGLSARQIELVRVGGVVNQLADSG